MALEEVEEFSTILIRGGAQRTAKDLVIFIFIQTISEEYRTMTCSSKNDSLRLS